MLLVKIIRTSVHFKAANLQPGIWVTVSRDGPESNYFAQQMSFSSKTIPKILILSFFFGSFILKNRFLKLEVGLDND